VGGIHEVRGKERQPTSLIGSICRASKFLSFKERVIPNPPQVAALRWMSPVQLPAKIPLGLREFLFSGRQTSRARPPTSKEVEDLMGLPLVESNLEVRPSAFQNPFLRLVQTRTCQYICFNLRNVSDNPSRNSQLTLLPLIVSHALRSSGRLKS